MAERRAGWRRDGWHDTDVENENRKLPAGGRHLTCLTMVPEFCEGDHQMRQKVCKLQGEGGREVGRAGEEVFPNLTCPMGLCC